MKPVKLGHTYAPSPLPNDHKTKGEKIASSQPFAQQLQQQLERSQVTGQSSLAFSKHALQRMDARGIEVTEDLQMRLNKGLQMAKSKGAKESLFLADGLAFVVNVKNNTVITAMEEAQMQQHVITNIDSAVMLNS
ncbi:TIGR02530 family flagellar biosynthesis protein [Caldalkalibacillus salinus]|uniref:TIGR02530 family flagellar biosynthesis protein n=1 Tax=Caldalkalibacillus salinus TaxID=2803787 RepID=UPI001920DC84